MLPSFQISVDEKDGNAYLSRLITVYSCQYKAISVMPIIKSQNILTIAHPKQLTFTKTMQKGMPKANINIIGRKISFRNAKHMLRNILIGPAVQDMYLRMKRRLTQERNTAKAPICHCPGVEHQLSLPLTRLTMKMRVKVYKANWQLLSRSLKYLKPLFTSCKNSTKSPMRERMHKVMAAAAGNL